MQGDLERNMVWLSWGDKRALSMGDSRRAWDVSSLPNSMRFSEVFLGIAESRNDLSHVL